MTTETPGERAEHAASVLAPEIGFLADPDVAGLGRSLAMVFRGALGNPAGAAQAWLRYVLHLAEIPPAALASWIVDPPQTGSAKYPVLYDGPGEYIHT